MLCILKGAKHMNFELEPRGTTMATKSPRSQAFLLGTRLVDRRAPAPERTLFSVGRRAGSQLLRLFTPQSAEASRIQPEFSVGSGCVELSVFREDKCPPKNSQKQDKKNISYKM